MPECIGVPSSKDILASVLILWFVKKIFYSNEGIREEQYPAEAVPDPEPEPPQQLAEAVPDPDPEPEPAQQQAEPVPDPDPEPEPAQQQAEPVPIQGIIRRQGCRFCQVCQIVHHHRRRCH